MTADTRATELPPETLEHLQAQHTLTLSTASLTGLPHAATFVYVNEGLAIYFATLPETRTAQNIDQNPVVSFTIDDYSPNWRSIKGVQAEGECQVLLNPGEIRHVVELFQLKFPLLSHQLTSNRSFFRVMPSEIYFINNEGLTDGPQDLTDYRRSLVFSVFRELPVLALERVETKLESMRVDAGQVIVRQGAPADKFFIVVDGAVEVVHDDGQTTRSLTTLRGGEFFGEIAILRDTPRTATVRAVAPTTLLAMDRETFRGLIAQALGTTQDFAAIVQERLARSRGLDQR
jgi:nitroimidazol reductase NimA-like FMN-containing flavoprotein (pyridoxamine 5'-phosphate oxidase superfamily)